MIKMAPKVHGQGGAKGHHTKESEDIHCHRKKRLNQINHQKKRNRKKHMKRTIKIVKAVTKPEILKQWAKKERLIAKRDLKNKKIRKFTFYCRLLAIDSLYLKHMPKRVIRINKKAVFRPPTKGTLGKTQKKDILERLNEMEAGTVTMKEIVDKQVRKLQKDFPKTFTKAA